MCEAERQLKKVAYELDMQQTAGIWNPGKIRAMLTTPCECETPANRIAS